MRKKALYISIPHILLAALLCVILFVPKKKLILHAPVPLLIALCIMEVLFLTRILRSGKEDRYRGPCYIITFVWLVMLIWEIVTSVLDAAHPVLVPAPENVFFTFQEHGTVMLLNIAYSLELLLIGLLIGLALAVILGLFCGWNPHLKAFSYPIANVLTPIPAIVISPFLVAIMPSFRSASAVVVILGVFWPQFLSTINRIGGIEPEILDSARMLKLSTPVMLFRILLPYLIPGILTGLKVTMTTSVLMLNFAELMGATHGMGYYVQNSIAYANYAHAIAGIICIGVVVTLLNCVVSIIQRRFIRWH